MKKTVLFASIWACGASVASVPEIANVVLTQDRGRQVTVTYDLTGGLAAVTMDVLTNGVSIGYAHFANAQGDVGAYVAPGTGKRITWDPLVRWPGVRAPELSVRLTARAANVPPDYLTVDLTGATRGAVRLYASTNDLPEGVGSDLYRTSKLLLRRIPAAHRLWDMGEGGGTIAPRHPVALQNDFWLGVFEVTQEQWKNVMGGYKGYFTADRATRPVESVSYFQVRANDSDRTAHFALGAPHADSFMGKLAALVGSGWTFDLPTEAQWEYACRAETATRYYNGTDDVQPEAVVGRTGSPSAPAPETAPADGGTQRVGSLAPNGFGLYDMYGNVSEWCVDCYHEESYGQTRTAGEAIDPCNWQNPMTTADDTNKNNTYVRRGGGWRDAASYGTSAARWYWNSGVNSVGFRVMCDGPTAAAQD